VLCVALCSIQLSGNRTAALSSAGRIPRDRPVLSSPVCRQHGLNILSTHLALGQVIHGHVREAGCEGTAHSLPSVEPGGDRSGGLRDPCPASELPRRVQLQGTKSMRQYAVDKLCGLHGSSYTRGPAAEGLSGLHSLQAQRTHCNTGAAAVGAVERRPSEGAQAMPSSWSRLLQLLK
jgi:hypothetical protein